MSNTCLADDRLNAEYNVEFTDIMEFIYGEDILSQGKEESVDMMFEGIDLEGKKILDLGSGLGGVSLYLAGKYNVEIVGIDRVSHLVKRAQDNLRGKKLKGNIKFIHIDRDNSLIDFQDAEFDIIFSKESILHVENKLALFHEANRILKPGGQIVVLDWLKSSGALGGNIKRMMEVDGLDLAFASEVEYKKLLENAKFDEVKIFSKNAQYIKFSDDNLQYLLANQESFIKRFNQNNFDCSVNSWSLQKKSFRK